MKTSNESINMVLCLAGKGQRFIDKGYATPKFLLKKKLKTESILELIIKNFYISGVINFFLVLNTKHRIWEVDIKESISKFKDCNFDIQFIEDTKGQAETAYHSARYIKSNLPNYHLDPLSFHNGDTILFNRDIRSSIEDLKNTADGAIDTFPAFNDAYSFVKTYPSGLISEIAEKKVISNMASSGLYIFKNCDTFINSYEETVFCHGEKYISEVFQTMLAKHSKILNIYSKNKKDTLILGTPEEYEKWKKNG